MTDPRDELAPLPRIKCGDCQQRQLLPLTDQVVFDHLAGRHVIGLYPLLADDHCHLLAVDFDESDWRDDARAFVQSCRELDVPAALEKSRYLVPSLDISVSGFDCYHRTRQWAKNFFI